jgi:hypothetical protein
MLKGNLKAQEFRRCSFCSKIISKRRCNLIEKQNPRWQTKEKSESLLKLWLPINFFNNKVGDFNFLIKVFQKKHMLSTRLIRLKEGKATENNMNPPKQKADRTVKSLFVLQAQPNLITKIGKHHLMVHN